MSKKTKLGAQAPIIGFRSDLTTKTEKNLSKNIKIKANEIPKARFNPTPPLLLKDDTETAKRVNIITEKGILNLLFFSNK